MSRFLDIAGIESQPGSVCVRKNFGRDEGRTNAGTESGWRLQGTATNTRNNEEEGGVLHNERKVVMKICVASCGCEMSVFSDSTWNERHRPQKADNERIGEIARIFMCFCGIPPAWFLKR